MTSVVPQSRMEHLPALTPFSAHPLVSCPFLTTPDSRLSLPAFSSSCLSGQSLCLEQKSGLPSSPGRAGHSASLHELTPRMA